MMSHQHHEPVLPEFPCLSALVRHEGGNDAVRLAVGLDMVALSRIEDSLRTFGDRFLVRIFTEAEQAYAEAAPAHRLDRLGARFAAKEAALKALGLADQGVGWPDIEVVRDAAGACTLALHGLAGELTRRGGLVDTALSLSHEGGFAAAIVVARFQARGGVLAPAAGPSN